MNLRDMMTYGFCIRHGLGRKINVDGLIFNRLDNTHNADAALTGIHSDVW